MENYWIKIKELNFYSVNVRAKTQWRFMEFISDDNISGIAEITDTQLNSSVEKIVAKLSNRFRSEKLYNEENLLEYIKIEDKEASKNIELATAISGIRSAFLDLLSKRIGLKLNQYLSLNNSDELSGNVDLYANINRSLLPDDNGPLERSPSTFAKKALSVEKRGFKTIKCAPFDECKSPFINNSGLPDEVNFGLDRISGISESISKDIKLYVDCHSRFDLETSYLLHDELFERNVKWFEEPIDPEKNQEDTRSIKKISKIDLAGAEMAYGYKTFEKLINNDILDIVMPDVKFCGGPQEVINLFNVLKDPKKTISMHCPSGPISLLTSAHITSSIISELPLEHAVDEVEWRKDLILPNESIINGKYILPEGNGIGATLNPEIISLRGKKWQE
ncbi:MAG: enolase C-terminal domain-like protein [Dehalococcoidia bacterium]|jgi:galactonate dehydratase|nr:enolase C-terminal domain-like protein [Dehalococcoidia bacterium]